MSDDTLRDELAARLNGCACHLYGGLAVTDFNVHADGSAIWLECGDCGGIAVEAMSLPASLDELVADSRDHVCGDQEARDG